MSRQTFTVTGLQDGADYRMLLFAATRAGVGRQSNVVIGTASAPLAVAPSKRALAFVYTRVTVSDRTAAT